MASIEDEQLQKELDAAFYHCVYRWQENMMVDIIQQQYVLIQRENTDCEI